MVIPHRESLNKTIYIGFKRSAHDGFSIFGRPHHRGSPYFSKSHGSHAVLPIGGRDLPAFSGALVKDKGKICLGGTVELCVSVCLCVFGSCSCWNAAE